MHTSSKESANAVGKYAPRKSVHQRSSWSMQFRSKMQQMFRQPERKRKCQASGKPPDSSRSAREVQGTQLTTTANLRKEHLIHGSQQARHMIVPSGNVPRFVKGISTVAVQTVNQIACGNCFRVSAGAQSARHKSLEAIASS